MKVENQQGDFDYRFQIKLECFVTNENFSYSDKRTSLTHNLFLKSEV
jgi:hypothetical protein